MISKRYEESTLLNATSFWAFLFTRGLIVENASIIVATDFTMILVKTSIIIVIIWVAIFGAAMNKDDN